MAGEVRFHNPNTDADIQRKWARDLLVQSAADLRVGPVLEVHCGGTKVLVEAVRGFLFVGEDDFDTTDGNAALIMAEFMVKRRDREAVNA